MGSGVVEREAGGSTCICLSNSKASYIFQLNSFQMKKGLSDCFVRAGGLWKHRERQSLYFPSTSLTPFLGLGREGGTTAVLMAVWIWGGREAGKAFEHVFPLSRRRLLCEQAKDLVSRVENRRFCLGDRKTPTPTTGFIICRLHRLCC